MHTWLTTCPSPDSWRARIERHIEVDWRGCWLWTGQIDRYGYGRFKWSTGPRPERLTRSTSAHRAGWLALVGPIPTGLLPDHLCRVRHCVNPDHLELVTNDENIRRGEMGRGYVRGREHRDKGPNFPCGHSRAEHTYTRVEARTGYVRRVCRPCAYQRSAEYKRSKQAA